MIRRSGYNFFIVIIIFIVAVGILGLGFMMYNENQIRVRVSKVNMAKVQDYIDVEVLIKSQKHKEYYGNQLRVKKLLVGRGDYVEKGQKLVSFDNNDILSQYAQAQIQLENVMLQKNQMIASSESFKRQKKNLQEEINILREVQEDKDGFIAELEESYDYGNGQYSANNLYDIDYGSEIDKLFRESEEFKRSLHELEIQRDSIPEISDEQIKLLDNYIILAENNLKNIEDKLAMYKDLEAEFNGVVTNININEGSYSQPGSTIIVIQDIQNVKGVALISKENISKVKVGQEVVINDSIGSYNGKISELGELSFIPNNYSLLGNNIEHKENFIVGEIEILNPDDKLKIDFDLKGKILLDSQINILKIPKSCILNDESGSSYVYVVKDGIAYKTYIITGEVSNGYTEIIEGIDSSEYVVLNPDRRMSNRSRVKVMEG